MIWGKNYSLVSCQFYRLVYRSTSSGKDNWTCVTKTYSLDMLAIRDRHFPKLWCAAAVTTAP